MMCKLSIMFIAFFVSLSSATTTDYESLAINIMNATGKQLESLYDINYIGFGGSMMQCAKFFSLSFSSQRSMEKSEAITILSSCNELLLKKINQTVLLRPFLSHYPATNHNTQIIIFFPNNKASTSFTSTSIHNGSINFYNSPQCSLK